MRFSSYNPDLGRLAGTLTLCCVGSAALAGGHYGPPYITDDPEPVDYKHWEFYIASYYFHPAGDVLGTLPHIEVNYGAIPNLQVHLIAPLAYDHPEGGAFAYGYGDTELGVKYRFVQETKSRPMVGVFPLIEVPTGSHARALGNGEAQVFLPIWIQKTVGNWTTYGGGGYWHNPGSGNHDYAWFGWLLQNQVSKPLALGLEVFHATSSPTVDGSATTGFNVGAVYDFDEGHHLLFSVGRGLNNTNSGTGYLAYQWTFGPKEKK
jgi:hypothetical protein